MQQHLEKANRQEEQHISEEVEGMGEPLVQRTKRNEVQPLRREGEAAEEVGRAQQHIEQMTQVQGQHGQQDLQPDIPRSFPQLPAENKGHQDQSVNLGQSKPDPGINIQQLSSSFGGVRRTSCDII